jgi:magnesium transporter
MQFLHIPENVCFCVLRFSCRTGPGQSFSTERLKHASRNGFAIEVMPLKCQDSVDDEALTLSLPKADNGYLKEEHPLRYKYSSIV